MLKGDRDALWRRGSPGLPFPLEPKESPNIPRGQGWGISVTSVSLSRFVFLSNAALVGDRLCTVLPRPA